MIELDYKKERGFKMMKKVYGIKRLLSFLLLGIISVSAIFPYRQVIQDGKFHEVRIQVQNKSTGLDVGKAD